LLFTMFIQAHAQHSKSYVVDEILYVRKGHHKNFNLDKNYIHSTTYLTDKKKIDELGFYNKDTIILITTKAHYKRSDSIRRIASTDYTLKNINKVWCEDNKPYTGPFINYYYSGLKKSEGTILSGKIEGKSLHYFKNGNLKEKYFYKNSYFDGEQEFYYKNGQIRKKGAYKNGKRIGIWKDYFTNGALKIKYHYGPNGETTTATEYYSNNTIKRKLKPYVEFQRNTSYNQFKVHNDHFNYSNYLKGQVQFRKREIKQISKKLDKLNEQIATSSPLDLDYYYRAILHGVLNQSEKSITDFKKTLDIEPFNSSAKYLLAISLIKKYLNSPIEEVPLEDISFICSGLNDKIGDEVHRLDDFNLKEYYKYCGN
jgi:antitoxin component YwqK of YwqJK toxin-antitoxin module